MKKSYSLPLSTDELLAEARRITGIDIVDNEVVEPLTVLVTSINNESQLHEAGAIAKQNKLLRLLSNRLRMLRDFTAHPEIADEKIENPVFILGMARSGTTKTHRVLSATGDFNFMPLWQVQYPALFTGDRDESPQARVDATDEYCRWLDETAPEIKLGHSFKTHAAEEDSLLTEQCFVAPSFFAYSEVQSYMEWFAGLGSDGMKTNFKFLRDVMKYLQWQGLATASKPWLLKAPIYYGFEPELLSVFPDAHILMTHRTPLSTVPSICKLLDNFHLPYSNLKPDPQALKTGIADLLKLHLHNRETHPTLNILDILFEDAVKDMETVAEKIYAHAGLAFSEESRLGIRNWGANNPIHKEGKFEYSLEEYGLSADNIEQETAGYIALIESLKSQH